MSPPTWLDERGRPRQAVMSELRTGDSGSLGPDRATQVLRLATVAILIERTPRAGSTRGPQTAQLSKSASASSGVSGCRVCFPNQLAIGHFEIPRQKNPTPKGKRDRRRDGQGTGPSPSRAPEARMIRSPPWRGKRGKTPPPCHSGAGEERPRPGGRRQLVRPGRRQQSGRRSCGR
jgi:hypothetical protein